MNRSNKVPRINRGFRPQDEGYTAKHDNPLLDPKIQMFTAEQIEDAAEVRNYYCSMCKERLDYQQGLNEWMCMGCGQSYDMNIQDVPVKDPNNAVLKPYTELMHYPTMDMDDPNFPLAEGIDVEKLVQDSDDVKLIDTTPDNRVQHIRVKGNPTKALSAQHKYQYKKDN